MYDNLKNGREFVYETGPAAHEKHVHFTAEEYAELQAKYDILMEDYEALRREAEENG